MQTLFLLSLLPTLLVALVAALILLRIHIQKRTCSLPPGPGGLPIIGHLHLLGKLPHQSLYQLSKSYGPLMSLRLGSVPVIVASSREMARQILQTHDLAFSHRQPPVSATHIYGDGQSCRDIAFSPPNSHWKLTRRLCATELFSVKRLQSFKQQRAEEIRTLMRSLLASSNQNEAPQMIRPKIKDATNNIIMRMMLGKRFSELGSGGERSLVQMIDEVAELLGLINVGDFLPFLEWIDLQGIRRRSKRLATEVRAAFEGIIHARQLANRDGHPPHDFLDVLLQASSSDTPIHIMEVLLVLFEGGTDTSAITVEWAIAELLLNQGKLRKVQAEIDDVVGQARLVEEEDIDNLPFLQACVKETLRLHPTLPLLVPHLNTQACKINGYHIPAKTQAYVNAWAIGRDPNVWESPTDFLPERFLEDCSLDVQGQCFELLPFGSGRRICPGWRLGLLNVQIILANLLQGFEWNCPPGYNLDMSESSTVITVLASPLTVYATPRISKELYEL